MVVAFCYTLVREEVVVLFRVLTPEVESMVVGVCPSPSVVEGGVIDGGCCTAGARTSCCDLL